MSDSNNRIRHDGRSAKKLLKELAWAVSFRLKMPLLDRMDRKSNPSQFWE
jgi:hypothetical protein